MIAHAADRMGAMEVARLEPDVILMELVMGTESTLDFLPDEMGWQAPPPPSAVWTDQRSDIVSRIRWR